MNEAASALGKLARGVPKRYTPEEIAKRTARLAEARDAARAQRMKKIRRFSTPLDEKIGVPS